MFPAPPPAPTPSTTPYARHAEPSPQHGQYHQGGPTQQQATPRHTPLPPQRRGPGWLGVFAASLLTALLVLGAGFGILYAQNGILPSADPSKPGTPVVPTAFSGGATDWKAVAEAVSPAVVTINADSPQASATGSGVIYNAEGAIVTNHHVISVALGNEGVLNVTLSDGRIYEASVVGTDPSTDLALIRIKNPPSDLTVANFGDSDSLKVGGEVMAIGSPLGLSNTVTTGIISALDRPVEVSPSESAPNPDDPFGQLPEIDQSPQTESIITNAIQVDASINPGNSGGPLFDVTGTVIGINSSIASLDNNNGLAGSIGLGFAIPVNLVRTVADELNAKGKVDHAALGVTIATDMATVDGTTRIGARITSVSPGSGAEEAGLKEDDVVIAVDGAQVISSKSLSGFIRRYKVGDTIEVTYVRSGEEKTAKVTLKPQGA
ncbi:MAG: trypsin [Actinobacteria bacterium]|nr:MAG: trypsin [Actinomycetota bacterium]